MKPFHKVSAMLPAVLTLMLYGAITSPGAQVHSDPVLFNGHYYAVNKDCMTWLEADDYTQSLSFRDPQTGYSLSGHLITITSQQENDFVYHTFVGSQWSHAWLGAYLASDEGGLAGQLDVGYG